jgi:hypothetical protein
MFVVGGGDVTVTNGTVTVNSTRNLFTANMDGTATIAADPVNNLDVATKQYVDNMSGGLAKQDKFAEVLYEYPNGELKPPISDGTMTILQTDGSVIQ